MITDEDDSIKQVRSMIIILFIFMSDIFSLLHNKGCFTYIRIHKDCQVYRAPVNIILFIHFCMNFCAKNEKKLCEKTFLMNDTFVGNVISEILKIGICSTNLLLFVGIVE